MKKTPSSACVADEVCSTISENANYILHNLHTACQIFIDRSIGKRDQNINVRKILGRPAQNNSDYDIATSFGIFLFLEYASMLPDINDLKYFLEDFNKVNFSNSNLFTQYFTNNFHTDFNQIEKSYIQEMNRLCKITDYPDAKKEGKMKEYNKGVDESMLKYLNTFLDLREPLENGKTCNIKNLARINSGKRNNLFKIVYDCAVLQQNKAQVSLANLNIPGLHSTLTYIFNETDEITGKISNSKNVCDLLKDDGARNKFIEKNIKDVNTFITEKCASGKKDGDLNTLNNKVGKVIDYIKNNCPEYIY